MGNEPSRLVSLGLVAILKRRVYLLAKRTKDKLPLQHLFVRNVETRMGYDFLIV